MLLALKNNKNHFQLLHHLLYVLSMITISGYMCTRVHLYKIITFLGDITNRYVPVYVIGSNLCDMPLAGHMSTLVGVYRDIM